MKYRVTTAHSVSGNFGYVVEKKGGWLRGWYHVSHVLPTLEDAEKAIEVHRMPDNEIVLEVEYN